MHDSSMLLMRKLLAPRSKQGATVLDCGSKTYGHPTYRPVVEGLGMSYEGLDIEPGSNVDLVADIYSLDLPHRFDFVISGQLLEHLERPWDAVARMKMHTKPGGWTIHIAPFVQKEHKYPIDCWRLLPDAMRAMLRGFEEVEAGIAGDLDSFSWAIRDCWGLARCPQ